ncbi:class I SAM-dependent DNA methyltransferase [Shimia sp. MIT910701]|jgi:demethylmenaquinone methyltransferase/2-methoxy-6-polyprenyl-1,4-benzoquinol methylase|uniref:class I SAM-dependent DNA methyltransferase n=1 Tax=Shimia sp. MIT910701 TaxID=3096987 RepID=UPI00399955C2
MAKAPLSSLYAQFSHRWHSDITRLGYPAAYDELMAALPSTTPAPTVMDAGCGTGALAQAWLKTNQPHKTLHMLDSSEEMLSQARVNFSATPKTVFHQDILGSTAIPQSSCDLLLSAHVIEHLDTPQDGLSWFASRLRKGGHIALSVSKPHWCTALVRWRWGHKAFTPSDVHSMLTATGFTNIQSVPFSKGPPSRTSCGYIALRA